MFILKFFNGTIKHFNLTLSRYNPFYIEFTRENSPVIKTLLGRAYLWSLI